MLIGLLNYIFSEYVIKKAVELLSQGKLFGISDFGDYLYGEVEGDTGLHVPQIGIDGSYICSCQAGLMGKLCSHLCVTLLGAQDKKINIQPYMKNMLKKKLGEEIKLSIKYQMVPTDLNAFNKMFGGVPVGTMFSIFGPPEAGKSILQQQFAFNVMKRLKCNSLEIDLEGKLAVSTSLPEWKSRFEKRYDIDTEIINVIPKYTPISIDGKPNKNYGVSFSFLPNQKEWKDKVHKIFFLDVRMIDKILLLLGRPIRLQMEESGKILVKNCPYGWIYEIENTPLGELIGQNNIKYVCFDSVTSPLEEFIGGQINYPSRADALGLWMARAQHITAQFQATVVLINHSSENPVAPEVFRLAKTQLPTREGGKIIGYNLAFEMFMEKVKSSKKPNNRKLWISRHPSKGSWRTQGYLPIELTNDGFIDAEDVGEEE